MNNYNDEGIVLKKVKLQNQKYIITLFTKLKGKQTFYFQNSSKKSNLIKHIQSLYLINFSSKKGKISQLNQLKDISFNQNYKDIPFNIHKTFIMFFINDILNNTIIEEEVNDLKYEFIKNNLLLLDEIDVYYDFHIKFLIHYTKLLGITPLIKNKDYNYLDIENGEFKNINKSIKYQIEKKYSLYIKDIMLNKILYKSIIALNNIERREILNIVLKYYSIHLKDFKLPKSLDTLNEIYNDL